MSELKAYGIRVIDGLVVESESGQLYLKSEADKVIELKDKEIAKLKEQYKDMDVTHTVHIAKMNAKIEELEDKCNMHDFFWDGCGFAKRGFKNTIAVSEAFDNLDAENQALKRALWLMTAEWAEAMGLASCNIAIKLSVKERFFYNDEADREKDIKKYRRRQVVFYKYADYCRAKAEEAK